MGDGKFTGTRGEEKRREGVEKTTTKILPAVFDWGVFRHRKNGTPPSKVVGGRRPQVGPFRRKCGEPTALGDSRDVSLREENHLT